ncbi:MAG TPA: hypothetical protein VLF60_01625 [Candidatus Saccharimonadales bacterium]|nr:hypothetical protein [Candidatus Saccharimonadales bacterium]
MDRYFEARPKPLDQTTLLASDMMRHLHSRQYLGKALVICDSPFSTMRVARKQWLKLARTIQRQRASTLNADKILRFTYTITHMQHMQFAAKTPLQSPDTHVFFVTPEQCDQAPLSCFTVYIASQSPMSAYEPLLTQLPTGALLVDLTGTADLPGHGLLPKHLLEEAVATAWQQVEHFFTSQNIDITDLSRDQFVHFEAMDDALDILLGASHDFLRIASSFQHAFELAQPLRVPKETQQLYNTLTLLAYRVQALTPGILSEYLLRTYHEDDTFFLHDIAADLSPEGESMLETITRHHHAGRQRLATALLASLERLSLTEGKPPGVLPEPNSKLDVL